ncbi:MAG: DNA primase, partial [Deltaproteobacteria bacterium]|nr:DNA primase [Deltaproteobacteria bacterium]
MKKFKYDKEIVKLHANGQWHYILGHLCPELDMALQRPGKHTWCPNPGHRGKNGDAFRLFYDYNLTGGGVCNTCGKKADGIAVIMWLTGWTFQETIEVIAQTIGLESSSTSQPERVVLTPPVIDTSKEDQEIAEKFCKSLNRTWNQSRSLASPEANPVRSYLACRGLNSSDLPPTLRYHSSL